MNKSTATKKTGGELLRAFTEGKSVTAAGKKTSADVQRLRALVNLLNMRIELLESELASYRNSSGASDS